MTEKSISYCSIREPVNEFCKQLQEYKNEDENNRIIVNEKLIFQKGDLVVFGSRPGIGKTSFEISLTRQLAVDQNIPIGIISPDINKHYISMRFISQIAEVDYKKLKNTKLSKNEISKIQKASEVLMKSPIYINDEQLISLEKIKKTIMDFSKKRCENGFY